VSRSSQLIVRKTVVAFRGSLVIVALGKNVAAVRESIAAAEQSTGELVVTKELVATRELASAAPEDSLQHQQAHCLPEGLSPVASTRSVAPQGSSLQ